MKNDSKNDKKKSNQFLSEIISPIFGHDFENRVVPIKEQQKNNNDTKEISYLEKQIEEKLEVQNKIAKVKDFQENLKTDIDVLQQYYKQQENEELQSTLPSNYLNFRDELEKTFDLSLNLDFDFDNKNFSTDTISEIIDEIFDK